MKKSKVVRKQKVNKAVCEKKERNIEDLEWAFYHVLRVNERMLNTINYLQAERDALAKLLKFRQRKSQK